MLKDVILNSNQALYSSDEKTFFVKPIWGDLNYFKAYDTNTKDSLFEALNEVLNVYNLPQKEVELIVDFALKNKRKFESENPDNLSEFIYAMY